MFPSKLRPLNISQYEHGRLAGVFAQLWGNDQFDKPAFDPAAFTQGITLHDWHYGLVDDLAIGGADESAWLEMVRRGADLRFNDPIPDIIAKLHLKRLLSGRTAPEIQSLIAQIESRIGERVSQTDFSRQDFEWADKITAFCDMLAFHFSFEAPITNTLPVYARQNSDTETPLTYTIKTQGEMTVSPWPFAVPHFSGLIIGFERPGYPETLTPKAIPYHCQPAHQ